MQGQGQVQVQVQVQVLAWRQRREVHGNFDDLAVSEWQRAG